MRDSDRYGNRGRQQRIATERTTTKESMSAIRKRKKERAHERETRERKSIYVGELTCL